MLPNPVVMEAVEKLNFQVTTADVASQTGLPLQVANREVANLASLTGGHLQVSQTGEIAYKFTPDFRQVLLRRSASARWQKFWRDIGNFLFYLLRISFGIVLVVSIVLVVVAIVVAIIIISSSSSNDDRSDSRSDNDVNWFGFLGNFFIFFDPVYVYDDYSYTDRPAQRPKAPQPKPEGDRGFLENVFSFLFGDGNPNRDLEDQRYRLIAQVIRNYDGVVIGEQILPYLDETQPSSYEDYMLPVLARFNGYPEVTPDGTIAYRFPDLMQVASRRPKKSVPSFLQEKLWRFNNAGDSANTLSGGLGVFYLGASLLLGVLLRHPAVQRNLTGFLGFVNGIFVFLLGYAILFLAIPTVRYMLIQLWNEPIKTRNNQRYNFAQQLRKTTPELKRKLQSVKALAIEQSAVSEQKLAYSTEEDLLLQELQALLGEEEEQV
jgi:hypothetical protein